MSKETGEKLPRSGDMQSEPTMSDLRDRIAAAVLAALNEHCLNGGRISSEFIHHDDDPYPSLRILDDQEIAERVAPLAADAVIAELELEQQWRADFGYDGYAKCATRDEAKEQVDDFNEALGADVQDGEQAMVMYRWVTDWKADDE